MIYIIYKYNKEKENIKNICSKINDNLYNGKNSILEKFYNKISIIDYSFLNNQQLLKEIDTDIDYVHSKDGNIFYKFYNLPKEENESERLLINLYTHIIACKNNELEDIALTGKDPNYLNLLYSCLENETFNKLKGIEDYNDFDDIYKLGLYAFSNNIDLYDNNDLINGFLYDREGFKTKYNRIMGEGSFDRLNYYCYSSIITYANDGVLPKIEYLRLLEDLKKYFDINIANNYNISEEERDKLINNFDELYLNTKHNYLNKKKKII